MKRVIMVGHVACGKTTLSQRVNGLKQTYQKTQALEFCKTPSTRRGSIWSAAPWCMR